MALISGVLGAVGALTTILGVLHILEIPSDAFISEKLPWTFWLSISTILFLGAITAALNRNNKGD
jgi:VIT1/CCC1 family predicted Fe2+/Mn2+ transporter